MEQETLGQRLRTLRKAHRLTQAKLAERAQVSKRSIIYWESDQYTPCMHELKALLMALAVPAPDQAQLLLSISGRRGDQILRSGMLQGAAFETNLPGAGDLLGALRTRQGISREQAAHLLGVTSATWGRWENNRYTLPTHLLPQVQRILSASNTEIQALQNRLPLPPDEAPFSVERAHEWALAFHYMRYLPGAQTVDLDALALQRRLWRLHVLYPHARIPLAQVTLDYAAWLLSQNRLATARNQAQQALNLYARDKSPLLSIAGPLSILSLRATSFSGQWSASPPSTYAAGLRLLNQWIPRIEQPIARALILADSALLAGQMDHFDTAQRYFKESERTLAAVKGETDNIRWYLQLAHANLLLGQDRPVEALNALHASFPEPEQTDPGINQVHFLLYTRLMLALNERDKARKWLDNINAGLTRVEVPRLRTMAEALAQKL